MSSFFALFHGNRLEYFLILLAVLALPYSLEVRALLRQAPLASVREYMAKADAARYYKLKQIHGNAYQLIVVIVGRLVSGTLWWCLVSLAVIVLFHIGTFMSLSILEDRRVLTLAFLAVFAAPLVGLGLALLWVARLLAELREYEESLKAVEQARKTA